ncbi:hypothetical protein AVEN_199151-1 [Araneus ventricosus]|uniref:Uncharacterized protein n=1 Tax=Araneus ventricosus TaxID=182803 RepID=A0A4Y2JZ92_ARAVE|nr:hypothetical protein AVEN_199151-1 [Araneus ventricosus]
MDSYSMIKNFKKHLEKSVDEDPYLMMLVLRTTPLGNGYNPAEFLMGRKPRTNLHMAKKSPMPKIPEAKDIKEKGSNMESIRRNIMTSIIRVKDLEELEPGQVVWITDQRSYGSLKAKHASPRSYWVGTPRGIIRRNCFHLRPSGQLEYDEDDTTREMPDFTRDSSPVSPPDDMLGSPNLSHSSPTTPSTSSAPRSPDQFYETRSGRTVRPPDRLDL